VLQYRKARMSLASKIKKLRIRNNRSLQELADEVGASKNHIWELETGKTRNPSIDLLTKLANSLGVSVAELIGENPTGEDEPPKVLAMYRELKELDEDDLTAIKQMMKHLKTRSSRKE
jgi:transcriptional regulator with XRE-family HTH domain